MMVSLGFILLKLDSCGVFDVIWRDLNFPDFMMVCFPLGGDWRGAGRRVGDSKLGPITL